MQNTQQFRNATFLEWMHEIKHEKYPLIDGGQFDTIARETEIN